MALLYHDLSSLFRSVNRQPSRLPITVAAGGAISCVPDGTFSLSLYSTNDLTPNNTYYTVQAQGQIGASPVTQTWTIQVPQTAGPFEISTITTTTPTASPTPSHVSTLTVDSTATFNWRPSHPRHRPWPRNYSVLVGRRTSRAWLPSMRE